MIARNPTSVSQSASSSYVATAAGIGISSPSSVSSISPKNGIKGDGAVARNRDDTGGNGAEASPRPKVMMGKKLKELKKKRGKRIQGSRMDRSSTSMRPDGANAGFEGLQQLADHMDSGGEAPSRGAVEKAVESRAIASDRPSSAPLPGSPTASPVARGKKASVKKSSRKERSPTEGKGKKSPDVMDEWLALSKKERGAAL